MYLADLENASEIVLDAGRKVRAPNQPRHPHRVLSRGGGSSGRAAAGAVRIANVVGAVFTNRRVIEPVEARITVSAGALLLSLAILFALFPRVIAYPLVLLFAWIAAALLVQGYKLHRARVRRQLQSKTQP
jgi:cardiolipin synthase